MQQANGILPLGGGEHVQPAVDFMLRPFPVEDDFAAVLYGDGAMHPNGAIRLVTGHHVLSWLVAS